MNIEFRNMEFPRSYNDFIYLGRPMTEEELNGCDKEGPITLCIGLKRKELEYYNKYHDLLNEDQVNY